ncbi:Rho GTPase [Puccinia graminis f. sp. tritici]|uniref:Rho GTPase n=1 Tax=Puccinia graminis f. sp. tritici TaxID=56615 RepID=A0A5B0QKI2_PUCGR|nr:Rho GTPase [Puccinia graminis f. sp. tritici]
MLHSEFLTHLTKAVPFLYLGAIKLLSYLYGTMLWLDQIIERCPGVKICLAALKCDLRDDPETRAHLAKQNQRPVDYEEGLATARRIRASRYLECSARQNRGVSEAFLEVAKVSISTKSTSVYNLIRPGYRYFKRDRSSSRSCLIT